MMHTVNMIHASGQGRSARRAQRIEEFLDAAERVVIAEGVETQAQLELLAAGGCGLYQGFLFSEPVEETALIGLMTRE